TFSNVPSDWVVESVSYTDARLALAGPEHFFRAVDPPALSVNFDMSNPSPGENVLPIGADNINAPPELRLVYVSPTAVPVVARRFVSATVPLVIPVTGGTGDSI